jgi:hypothetical protein
MTDAFWSAIGCSMPRPIFLRRLLVQWSAAARGRQERLPYLGGVPASVLNFTAVSDDMGGEHLQVSLLRSILAC